MAPARARETLFSVVVEGLRRRSQHGPIIVWLDDLQWADRLVIDLLGRITRSLVDRCVLVITAHRDDVDIDWPPASDHPITVRMPLDPLSRDEAHELVEAVLGDGHSAAFVDRLYERSGGNPLFLTELAAMIRVAAGQHGAARIAAGADRLDARSAARRAASRAGQRGRARNVGLGRRRSCCSPSRWGRTSTRRTSRLLVDDGLLDVTDDGPGQLWRFRSDVVREVAYQTLTKLVRAQRHAGTASAMAHMPQSPDRPARAPRGDGGRTRRRDRAGAGRQPQHQRTGGRACSSPPRSVPSTSGAFNQAQRHAGRALDLCPSDPVIARELLLVACRGGDRTA